MHLNRDNMSYSSPKKLNQIYKVLSNKMVTKLKVNKLFFGYLANYVMLKRMTFPISKESVAKVELLVMDHLPSFCFGVNTDFEYIFFILIICYEIYIYSLDELSACDIFSKRFLKFLRNLSFLFQPKTWRKLYQVLSKQTLRLNSYLSFSNPGVRSTHYSTDPHFGSQTSLSKSANLSQKNHHNSGNNRNSLQRSFAKIVLGSPKDCLVCLMHVAFYLLQQPHDTILSNFIFVNQEESKFPISEIMHLSSFMERSIADVYKTRRSAHTLVKIKSEPQRVEKLRVVFTHLFGFFSLQDLPFLAKLPLISKKFSRFLGKCVCKKILVDLGQIPKNTRIRIYQKLIVLDAEAFYDSVRFSRCQKAPFEFEDSSKHIQTIKKDVFRTKFFKGDPQQLEKLLTELAEFVPSLGYFQGLNCLGAFMLEYTGDYLASHDIISFLMHKQMKKYFMGDFQFLNKLIFVGERLIREHFPIVHDMLSQSEIGHDFYMSSIIVTIYFNILQFSKNYFFLLSSLDLFFAEGWIGFYKVRVCWEIIEGFHVFDPEKSDEYFVEVAGDSGSVF